VLTVIWISESGILLNFSITFFDGFVSGSETCGVSVTVGVSTTVKGFDATSKSVSTINS